EKIGLFKLGKVLPSGAVFPFDFGFIPSTAGEDGDPLDVLLVLDEPAFVGCLVPARLVGVVEARQTEKSGEHVRNDRLIAVPIAAKHLEAVQSLSDIGPRLIQE